MHMTLPIRQEYFYLLLPEFGCRVVVGGGCVGSSVIWAEKPNAKFSVYFSYAQIHNSQINEWLSYGSCEIRNLGKGKGQLISKANFQAVDSQNNERTNLVCLTWRVVT